ncbi:MAG: glucokinase [Nanoarchaeota archaeon]|nr:glucokinase [Nanoarchaeota archaeon]
MILTIDTGMSNIVKIAAVDNSYRLQDTHLEPVAPENLQEKIIQEVQHSRLEKLAISSTWFVSEDGSQGFIEKDGRKVAYIDLPEIQKRTGLVESAIAIYNDAEATALALNVPHHKRIIQEGNVGLHDAETKTLIYLGTGFQLVRNQYHFDIERYLPDYGGGLMAAVPVSLLEIVNSDFLKKIADISGVGEVAKLRHTHLLSARGLGHIHTALTEEKKDAKTIIDEKDQHQQTFMTYSKILGRCLQNFASTAGFDQALYIGGTFAAAIAPHLDHQALRESFAVPHHLTRKAYKQIPIIVIDEPFAGNLGAAYGLREEIETSAGIQYAE